MPNFENVDYGDELYDHGNGCTCERHCVCGRRPQDPPKAQPQRSLREVEDDIMDRYPSARSSIEQVRRWEGR